MPSDPKKDIFMANQVEATEPALQLLKEIIADYGPVIFHQSGGCCDGSAPMCHAEGDLIIADHVKFLNHT